MTQKPKLEPGQRVRLSGVAYVISEENFQRFGEMPGTVTAVDKPCDEVQVDLDRYGMVLCSPRLCTKLRPKQKPEKERGRIRCRAEIVEGDRSWISAKFFDRGGSQLFPRGTRPAGMEPEGVCLTEMRQGEIVLGREELARAWDSSPLNTPHHISIEFLQVCEALGLGKDKA